MPPAPTPPPVLTAFRCACVLLLGLAGPALADEPVEWEREAQPDVFYESPVNTAGGQTHTVIRVVDDATGEGIPGATAALHSQDQYPITGFVAPDRIGVADADGWIRIRVDDLGWGASWTGNVWQYVEAPGYAGCAAQSERNEIRLSRARMAIVEVRDALDRPVEGALLGIRCSNTCGHMPDQRLARTGLDGRAVIPDVAPPGLQDFAHGWECSSLHPALEMTYHELELTRPAGTVQRLQHRPSVPVVGTVLDADGKPLVGARVGSYGSHRGPWTLTDAHGDFRLEGAERGTTIYVHPPGRWSANDERSFTPPPPGVRRTFRLLPDDADEVPTPKHAVNLVVRDKTTKEAMGREVPIVAVRDIDGFTVAPENGSLGPLPPGVWTLHAGGGVSPWLLTLVPFTVPDAEKADDITVTAEVVRHPDVRIAFTGDVEAARVALVSATDVRAVSAAELKAGTVPVPTVGEFAFRVEYDTQRYGLRWVWVPIPLEGRAPAAPPIAIPFPTPVTLHAKLLGPDGKAVPGWLATEVSGLIDTTGLDADPPDGPAAIEPEASYLGEGQIQVLAIPEGRAHLPRLVRVALPTGSLGGGRVELGVIRLEARGDRRLSVVRADGKFAEYHHLRVVRDGVVRGWTRPEETEVCDPLIAPLAEGDVVEVRASWLERPGQWVRPVRQRLTGPGPWTIRPDFPDTSITVDPIDEAGADVDALLVIDGAPFRAQTYVDEEDGRRVPVRIHGLALGPHDIALSAENHATRHYRVVLKAGEHRTLNGRMRAVPPPPAPDEPRTPPQGEKPTDVKPAGEKPADESEPGEKPK